MASPLQVVLNISEEEAKKGRCIECLACELKACELGVQNIRIDLPMPGVDGYGEKTNRGAGGSPAISKTAGGPPAPRNSSGNLGGAR